MYRTRVGVDLAKEVIQVCTYTSKKVQSNIEMTPSEFLSWLINSKPATIILIHKLLDGERLYVFSCSTLYR